MLAGGRIAADLPVRLDHPRAPVISEWNAVATATLQGDTGKALTETFLYLGFVHAAMYDAVVGVHPRYQPYRRHAPAPRHASATAAAAAAGHRILQTYSPYARAALDDALAASLARVPDDAARTAGVAYGERVAQDLIDLRVGDGRNAPVQYTRMPAPGVWRPTPPAYAPMALPWLGGVTPLLARSATQFVPPAPPALTSRRYTRDFAEVQAMGSATSTTRTAAQTETARFYAGNAVVQIKGAVRHYRGSATLRADVVDARIWLGIHFRTADTAARTLGIDVADWSSRHYFQPVRRAA